MLTVRAVVFLLRSCAGPSLLPLFLAAVVRWSQPSSSFEIEAAAGCPIHHTTVIIEVGHFPRPAIWSMHRAGAGGTWPRLFRAMRADAPIKARPAEAVPRPKGVVPCR